MTTSASPAVLTKQELMIGTLGQRKAAFVVGVSSRSCSSHC